MQDIKDIEGWKVQLNKLHHHNRCFNNFYYTYKMFESKSGRLGALLYDIAEIRMNWEVGRLAIYRDKEIPRLILNPKSLMCFYTNNTIQFSENERFAFIKAVIQNISKNVVEVPLLMLDLYENNFAIIKMVDSLSCEIIEKENGQFILSQKYKDDRFESHDGQIININSLNWISIAKIEKITQIYFE